MKPVLSFDGCGINRVPTEAVPYGERIATFQDRRGPVAMQYGPLFAAVPALVNALELAQKKLHWLKTSGFNEDRAPGEPDTLEIVNAALVQAKRRLP